MKMIREEELAARCIRSYFRRFGEQAPQPAHNSTDVEECLDEGEQGNLIITLNNINGRLARYFYRPATDRLTYLEDQGSEQEEAEQ